MHPAFSVIFFTVVSGAGYGLFAMISMVYIIQPDEFITAKQTLYGCILALTLITMGLVSSTFHLANPRNAWRAFSRVRTSWLAREGVLAVAFYPLALGYMYWLWSRQPNGSSAFFTVVTVFVVLWSISTVFSTGMIYACLKTIRQWHNALTPINYILLGTMLGGLLLLVVLSITSEVPTNLIVIATYLIIAAAVAKIVYFFWIGMPSGPTINTATSFTRNIVRLLDVGHTAGTFLTDEFGFQVARFKLIMVRWAVVLFAFIAPTILLWVGTEYFTAEFVTVAAAASAFLGVALERWLFFAEARHVVNLYHGLQQC